MAGPYQNKSAGEIKSLIAGAFQREFSNRLKILPKSFVDILAAVFAGVFVVLYKQIGWFFLQQFPSTAYFGEVEVSGKKMRPLVKWGQTVGEGDPLPGRPWQGGILVRVARKNTVLKQGAQLKSPLTGKIYVTLENRTLEGDTETIRARCAENGAGGNLAAGEELQFVNPHGNVQSGATVEIVTRHGSDDESEEDYRARVERRWRNPPLGGALSDYRAWAREAPGVLEAYPYKDAESPAGVIVYVSGIPSIYPDRIPDKSLLLAAGRSCTYDSATGKATRKPLCAVIDPRGDGSYENIRPVTVLSFDVHISGFTGRASDFALAAKSEIENYFLGREPYIRGLSDDDNKTNAVTKNNVLSAADQTAVSQKASFAALAVYLNGEMRPSYELGAGELCKLGVFSVDGAQY